MSLSSLYTAVFGAHDLEKACLIFFDDSYSPLKPDRESISRGTV